MIYENTWLVLDGIDGLRDASDMVTMRKIFSGVNFKGCFVLMSMNNDYYKILKHANILNNDNHSEISVDPNTFPLVYEEYTKLQLQQRGYEVSMATRRFSVFVRRYCSSSRP